MDEFSFSDLINDFNDKTRKFSCDLIIKNDFMELSIEDLTCIEIEDNLAVVKNKLSNIKFEIPEIVYFSPDKDGYYVYSFDLDNVTFTFILQECIQ